MFEFLKKLVAAVKPRTRNVVFYVDLPAIPSPPPTLPSRSTRQASQKSRVASGTVADRMGVPGSTRSLPNLQDVGFGSHRERLLTMRIEHLKLCSPKRCRQLSEAGVQTAGDLIYCQPKNVSQSFRNPERAERAVRRFAAAVRLALAVDTMMPRDALLLVAIHRRSVASLSRESAAILHRDLQRFSMSSRGGKLTGRRGVPSLRRVKSWVATCRELKRTGIAVGGGTENSIAFIAD